MTNSSGNFGRKPLRCAAAVEDCSKRFGAMACEALSSRTGIPVSALGGNTLSEMILGHLAQRVGEKRAVKWRVADIAGKIKRIPVRPA